MTDVTAKWIREQARFRGISEFDKKILLSSPHIYRDETKFINEAFDGEFDGTQVKELGKEISSYMGIGYAVPLHSGAAALHMAVKLAAEKLYGSSTGIVTPDGVGKGGALYGKRAFCSDFTEQWMIAPVIYEGGEPVFIDSSDLDWSMDPEVLELAFGKYPEVKLVIMNHAYGFPGQIAEIRRICDEHGALLIECAGESFGACVRTESCGQGIGRTGSGAEGGPGLAGSKTETGEEVIGKTETRRTEEESSEGVWKKTGTFGDYGILDFGRDRIIPGSSGGALLARDFYASEKASYWAEGAMAAAPWNQHEELGYRYGMDDLAAAVLRGQLKHIEEHITKKKAIYERYLNNLDDDLVCMIPEGEGTQPNYWMPCMTCESNIQFMETRSERQYTYTAQHGTAAPMEIYDALMAFGAESRPVYKPMSMQPLFRNYEHFTLDGAWRCYENFRNDSFWVRCDRAKQYFESGLCLPGDIRMTKEEQDKVIEIILACFYE